MERLAHGLATQRLFASTIAAVECELRDGMLHHPRFSLQLTVPGNRGPAWVTAARAGYRRNSTRQP